VSPLWCSSNPAEPLDTGLQDHIAEPPGLQPLTVRQNGACIQESAGFVATSKAKSRANPPKMARKRTFVLVPDSAAHHRETILIYSDISKTWRFSCAPMMDWTDSKIIVVLSIVCMSCKSL
jgi:hypothetical protein